MQATKYCARCRQLKLENEFPKGSGSYCIECKREYSREHEKTRVRDHHAANVKRWAQYKDGIRDAFVDYLEELPPDYLIEWFVARPKNRIVPLVEFARERDVA